MTRGQEVVRWLIFLPALLIGLWLVGILASCNDLGGQPGKVLVSGVMGAGLVRLAFGLAPRWKVVIAWLACVLPILGIVALVAIMAAASLDAFGADHPAFSWLELFKAVAWAVGAIVSLQHCAELVRRQTTSAQSRDPPAP
jgi:hypothetical protein